MNKRDKKSIWNLLSRVGRKKLINTSKQIIWNIRSTHVVGRLEQSKADGSAGFKFYVEGGKGLTEKINFEQT